MSGHPLNKEVPHEFLTLHVAKALSQMTHTLNEDILHLFCVQPPANRHTLLMPHRSKNILSHSCDILSSRTTACCDEDP